MGKDLDVTGRQFFPTFFPLFSHFLKFDPYSRKPNSLISYIQRQFHAIHSSHLGSCVNTVGESICLRGLSLHLHELEGMRPFAFMNQPAVICLRTEPIIYQRNNALKDKVKSISTS